MEPFGSSALAPILAAEIQLSNILSKVSSRISSFLAEPAHASVLPILLPVLIQLLEEEADDELFMLYCLSSYIKEPKLRHVPLTDYYGPHQFYQNFRMSQATFDNLVTRLSYHMPQAQTGRPARPLRDRVAAVICKLASTGPIRAFAEAHNCTQSTLWSWVVDISRALVHGLGPQLVCFPAVGTPERADIMKQFHDRSAGANGRGFTNCIGAVDGSLFELARPLDPENPQPYFCRKGYPAMQAQGVCSLRLKFLSFTTGWPGCVNDQRMFDTSALARTQANWADGAYVISDAGYTLGPNILPAFDPSEIERMPEPRRSHANLFNRKLSTIRSCIERAWGMLKVRWRPLLKSLDAYSPEQAQLIITACVVLHNFCLDANDSLSVEDEQELQTYMETALEEQNQYFSHQNHSYMDDILLTYEQQRFEAGKQLREFQLARVNGL